MFATMGIIFVSGQNRELGHGSSRIWNSCVASTRQCAAGADRSEIQMIRENIQICCVARIECASAVRQDSDRIESCQ
jgi:hypothetical protein